MEVSNCHSPVDPGACHSKQPPTRWAGASGDDVTARAHMAVISGPLDRRLALCALALSLRPGLDRARAVQTLQALAAGNRTALLRAIARIRRGMEPRSAPCAERALGALRFALATLVVEPATDRYET